MCTNFQVRYFWFEVDPNLKRKRFKQAKTIQTLSKSVNKKFTRNIGIQNYQMNFQLRKSLFFANTECVKHPVEGQHAAEMAKNQSATFK